MWAPQLLNAKARYCKDEDCLKKLAHFYWQYSGCLMHSQPDHFVEHPSGRVTLWAGQSLYHQAMPATGYWGRMKAVVHAEFAWVRMKVTIINLTCGMKWRSRTSLQMHNGMRGSFNWRSLVFGMKCTCRGTRWHWLPEYLRMLRCHQKLLTIQAAPLIIDSTTDKSLPLPCCQRWQYVNETSAKLSNIQPTLQRQQWIQVQVQAVGTGMPSVR